MRNQNFHRRRASVRHRRFHLDSSSALNSAPALLLIQTTRAKRDTGAEQRRRSHKRDWIERRRRKIDNSVFICPRRLRDVTAAARRAKVFRELLQMLG